jgi:hypothetical protein
MCHEWKPVEDFAFRSKKEGTRQSHCRKCHAAYRRQHYLANRDTYIKREVERIKGYRISNRSRILEYLSTHPCVDCGETDVVVLEFDHRDASTKSGDVTFIAARKSWRTVKREIAKCDVRCANCHRRRTARQFAWTVGSGTAIAADDNVGARRRSTADTLEPVELRTCTRCGESKPLTEFSVKDHKNGRRARICKTCIAAASRAHYYRNREKHLVRARATKKKYRQRNRRKRAELIQGLACVDCGETDVVVLEFDHRDRATKKVEVSRLMSSGSIETLLEEIAKCDVRCANCHRRKTSKEFGYYRLSVDLASAAISEAA